MKLFSFLLKTIHIYLLSLSAILLFTFQGCTAKESKIDVKKIQKQIASPSPSRAQDHIKVEEVGNEFEDEYNARDTNHTSDPLSGYNRLMTSFNDTLFTYGLNPISEAYAYVIPQPIRIGISNAIHNIQFPIRFANTLLQGKFQNASNEFERFIVNSTVGLAGLMDPAKNYMNIPAYDEDFGQTLGYYGVGSGIHIVLPFFGPSNLRDIAGISIDAYASPLVNIRGMENYKIPDNLGQSAAIVAVYYINKNSLHLGEYESLKKDAVDLYPFLRDIYEQKRNSEIAE